MAHEYSLTRRGSSLFIHERRAQWDRKVQEDIRTNGTSDIMGAGVRDFAVRSFGGIPHQFDPKKSGSYALSADIRLPMAQRNRSNKLKRIDFTMISLYPFSPMTQRTAVHGRISAIRLCVFSPEVCVPRWRA